MNGQISNYLFFWYNLKKSQQMLIKVYGEFVHWKATCTFDYDVEGKESREP